MIYPLRIHHFPGSVSASHIPHPGCLFFLPNFSVQHIMPPSLCPLFIKINRMRCISDPPAIHSRPSTQSSQIMIVKMFVVIAHGPMVNREAFSRVNWLLSTVRGGLGYNIKNLTSITRSVRRRRGRMPAQGLFPSVFPINPFRRLMLVVVGTGLAMMFVFVVFLILVMIVEVFAGNNCVRCLVGVIRE